MDKDFDHDIYLLIRQLVSCKSDEPTTGPSFSSSTIPSVRDIVVSLSFAQEQTSKKKYNSFNICGQDANITEKFDNDQHIPNNTIDSNNGKSFDFCTNVSDTSKPSSP